jgi:hypothetical protein
MVMQSMYSLEFHKIVDRANLDFCSYSTARHSALHKTNSQKGISVGLICLWTMVLDYNSKIVGKPLLGLLTGHDSWFIHDDYSYIIHKVIKCGNS